MSTQNGYFINIMLMWQTSQSCSINNVSKSKSTREKTDYGKKLEARRDLLRKSLDFIEKETEGRLYRQLVYRLEFGDKKPDSLLPQQIDDLAMVLEWTPLELADVLGLELPKNIYGEKLDYDNWLVFPVTHSAKAGEGKVAYIEGETAMIPRKKLQEVGAIEENIMAVRVNGDCLVSSDVKKANQSIGHGDTVFIDTGRMPQRGQKGVYWDTETEQLIIKYHGEQVDGFTILYDARGMMYNYKDIEGRYIPRGVVIYRGG